MSQIRGSNTKPEMALRKYLWSRGFRYRLRSKLPGKPDIIFVGAKIAIFVDGCFWHGCPEHGTQPKTNKLFWREKIEKNIRRDYEVNHLLREQGWIVLRFWEHQIKTNLADVFDTIRKTKEIEGH